MKLLQVAITLLYTCSTLVHCTEESISTVYGLPVHSDRSNPYQALYQYDNEIRDSKSLLNTFPFNQEEIRLTENLSNDPINSKQTSNRGVAREAPKNKIQLNLPQYSFLRQQEGDGEFTTLQPLVDPTETADSDSEGNSDSGNNLEATTSATDEDTTNTDEGVDSTESPTDLFGGVDKDDDTNYYGSSALNTLASLKPDKLGKKCVNKVMMVEETVWDDVEICDHSYDRRCHTSYTTTFEAQQQQECEENYRKNCFINYDKIAFNQTVQICRNPLVKDCSTTGNTVCRTEYESECQTRQEEYEVDDDVVDCQELQEEKCRDVVFGYTTQTKCQKFPRNECSVKKQKVKKYSPITDCKKVPIELCAPAGCGFKQGAEQCYDKVQTIVQDQPSEECTIEPQRVCKHVTKLVPRLMPQEECVDVPKEICSRARRNPRKVQKPMIKQWCYVPSQESGLA